MNKKLFYICAIISVIFLKPVLASAETMYITDRLEVTIRAGKGLEYKILAIARSNEKVEVLNTEGEYANLRFANGIEGWILKRYLTGSIPKSLVISNLKSKIEKLKGKNNSAVKEIRKLKEKKVVLENTNETQEKKIETLENEYEDLKVSCSDYIKLRDDHEKLRKEMVTSRRKVSKLSQENEELRRNTNLMWFVAGGSAVLIGFIIGLILQNLRNKRKKKLSF
jgi:SH3 domain protein